jgi:hypothetical protein
MSVFELGKLSLTVPLTLSVSAVDLKVIAGEVVALLSDPGLPKETVRALRPVIQEAHEQQLPVEQVAEAVEPIYRPWPS